MASSTQMDLRKRVDKSKKWVAAPNERVLAAAIGTKVDVAHAVPPILGTPSPIFGAPFALVNMALRAFKKRQPSAPLSDRLDNRVFLVLTNQRLSIHGVTVFTDRPGRLIHEWPIDAVGEINELDLGGKCIEVAARGAHLRLRCPRREPREQLVAAFRVMRQGFGTA